MGNANASSSDRSGYTAAGGYRELKKVNKAIAGLEQIRIAHSDGTVNIAGAGGDKFESGIAEFVRLKQVFAAELDFMRKIVNSISHADDTKTFTAEAASMRHEVRIYLQRCRDLVAKMTKVADQLQQRVNKLDKVDKIESSEKSTATSELAPDGSVIVCLDSQESKDSRKLQERKVKVQGCRQLIQCYEREIVYFHQVSASDETRKLDLKIATSEAQAAALRRIAVSRGNAGDVGNGSISNFTSDDDEEKEDDDRNRRRRDRRDRRGRRNSDIAQQQQIVEFEERKDVAIAEQDVIIDEIAKGVENLHGMAVSQGKELKKQTAVLDEVDFKLDVNIDKIAEENRRLDEIAESQMQTCRRCLMIFFAIVLCSLLFYIYQSVWQLSKSSTK